MITYLSVVNREILLGWSKPLFTIGRESAVIAFPVIEYSEVKKVFTFRSKISLEEV